MESVEQVDVFIYETKYRPDSKPNMDGTRRPAWIATARRGNESKTARGNSEAEAKQNAVAKFNQAHVTASV